MIMNMDVWAENINRIVFEEYSYKYNFWSPGFKVFYSRVMPKPRLTIISDNPGGDESSFKEDLVRFSRGDFRVLAENSYLDRDYPMARKMRKFFDEHVDLLKGSVIFPLLFFRSESKKYWKTRLENNTRSAMEAFCYKTVKEIIQTIKTRAILVLGISTYRRLKKYVLGEIADERCYLTISGRRMSYQAEWNGLPIFAIIHPTGARLANVEWDRNKKIFFDIIA